MLEEMPRTTAGVTAPFREEMLSRPLAARPLAIWVGEVTHLRSSQ